MLLHLDQYLYTTLTTLALYNPSQAGGVALTTAIDTPLPSGNVVRWATSEYLKLYDDGTQPFLAIQLLGDDYENAELGVAAGAFIWEYTDETRTQAAVNFHPQPVVINYNLELLAPDDLWLRRMEKGVKSFFGRRLVVEIDVQPLGATVGAVAWPSTLMLNQIRRVGDLNAGGAMVRSRAEEQRLFRSVASLKVESWLLSPDSLLELQGVYKSAQVEILERDSGDELDTFTIPYEGE